MILTISSRPSTSSLAVICLLLGRAGIISLTPSTVTHVLSDFPLSKILGPLLINPALASFLRYSDTVATLYLVSLTMSTSEVFRPRMALSFITSLSSIAPGDKSTLLIFIFYSLKNNKSTHHHYNLRCNYCHWVSTQNFLDVLRHTIPARSYLL